MLWGFNQFQKGMQESDDRYQTKRQKNLQFYREWRQLFPDAPISDHQNVIDTLSGGSSYLQQQLPSTEALRSYADRRKKDREYTDFKMQNEKFNSHLDAMNNLTKMVDNKININSTWESLREDISGMFPDPSSRGAKIAEQMLREYEPTFQAKLVNRKNEMAIKIADAMQGVDADDAADAAASLGLQANDEILKLATAKRKRVDRTERGDKVAKFSKDMRNDTTVQGLLNIGTIESLKKAQDYVTDQAGFQGLTLDATEIENLNRSLKSEQTARTPIIANEAVKTVSTRNPGAIPALQEYMVKQGANLNPEKLKEQIATYATVGMNAQAKQAFVQQIYNRLTSSANVNMQKQDYVKKAAAIIGPGRDYDPQSVAARLGIDPRNSGLIKNIIDFAKGDQAEKTMEVITKINNDVQSDQVLMSRLSSTDPEIRENAIAEIKNRYARFKVSDAFDSLSWRMKAFDAVKLAEPALIRDTVEKITKSPAFQNAVKLGNDGKDSYAIQVLMDSIPKTVQGKARQDIFEQVFGQLNLAVDTGIVTLQKSLAVQTRKAADERYTVEVDDLIDKGAGSIQAWFANKINKDDDDPEAIKVGGIVPAFLRGKDIASGDDLTAIFEVAWAKSGKDQTVFQRDQIRLLNEAYAEIAGNNKLSRTRQGYIKSQVDLRTADVISQKVFSAKQKEIEIHLGELRTVLDTFSAPLHVGKDGKASGTNDPMVFQEKKKDAVLSLFKLIDELKKSAQAGTVIFGDLEAGTFADLQAMQQEIQDIYNEPNPVKMRMDLQNLKNAQTQSSFEVFDRNVVGGQRQNALGYRPRNVVGGQSIN